MSGSEMCPQSINRHNWSGRCNCAKAVMATTATRSSSKSNKSRESLVIAHELCLCYPIRSSKAIKIAHKEKYPYHLLCKWYCNFSESIVHKQSSRCSLIQPDINLLYSAGYYGTFICVYLYTQIFPSWKLFTLFMDNLLWPPDTVYRHQRLLIASHS